MSSPRRHDDGLTLPELLVGVAVLGLIMAVLSSTIIVTLRQRSSSEGRVNVARTEMGIGTWLPADLSSAETVSGDGTMRPCPTTGPQRCPDGFEVKGVNVLFATWTTREVVAGVVVDAVVTVSYRYVFDASEHQLVRYECKSIDLGRPTCSSGIAAHNIEAPPANVTLAGDGLYRDKTTNAVVEPSWAVIVSEPYNPDDTGGSTTATTSVVPTKGAKKVLVTVNGGGGSAGAGGGQNQITLSAGGTERTTIAVDSVSGVPQFTQARSRCGGPIALVIDSSGSIGEPNMVLVRNAAKKFVDVFDGTPVQLLLVDFDTTSKHPTSASSWTTYYDMTKAGAATTLRTAIDTMTSGGATNWEDALFRSFYNADGTVQTQLPETVVFFTDGVPTTNRRSGYTVAGDRAAPGVLPALPAAPTPAAIWPVATGSAYNQESFERAQFIADKFRATVNFVGIGVGGINDSSNWGRAISTGYRYEQKVRGDWVRTSQADYQANYEDNDSYRKVVDGSSPYVEYTWSDTPKVNKTILAQLIARNDTGVPATMNASGAYTNADAATMYTLGTTTADWDALAGAMQAIALAKCGGTVTLQTRVVDRGSVPVQDPFTYQNTSIRPSTASTSTKTTTTVTNDMVTTAATFDFDMPNGQYVDVEIQPVNLDNLKRYEPVAWVCRAGPNPRSVTLLPIEGSSTWKGIRVRVDPNQAVSCILQVKAR